jgi:hypothetical protein
LPSKVRTAKSIRLQKFRGPKGTLVVFICNHCPYVKACTPDFFGFNAQDELQYRGRLDASRMTPIANARRDLFEAMKQIAETGHGPKEQIPSMGCSIKWKH